MPRQDLMFYATLSNLGQLYRIIKGLRGLLIQSIAQHIKVRIQYQTFSLCKHYEVQCNFSLVLSMTLKISKHNQRCCSLRRWQVSALATPAFTSATE